MSVPKSSALRNTLASGERAELYRIGDVAAMLNVSVRHLHRLIKMRRIPAPVKLGKSIRWTPAIARWIESGCPTSRKGAR